MLAGLPGGSQVFWGVPFQLAAGDTAPAWIVLGTGSKAVDIALPPGTTASYVVFAHFCNGSRDGVVHARARCGSIPCMRPASTWPTTCCVYADGSEHRQPIRRRFEINERTSIWGHCAFAARPARRSSPPTRVGPTAPGQLGAQPDRLSRAEPYRPCVLLALRPAQPAARAATVSAIRLEPTGADTPGRRRHHPLPRRGRIPCATSGWRRCA